MVKRKLSEEIEKDKAKTKEALLKMALGYEVEEKEITADKNGKQGKVKITKKQIPPDIVAIRTVLARIENNDW